MNSKFFRYKIYWNNFPFAAMFSSLPLLPEKIKDIDRKTWGSFRIEKDGDPLAISFLSKRTYGEITSKILENLGITNKSNSFEFFIIPLCFDTINSDYAKSDIEFMNNFIKVAGIELTKLYKIPEKPNELSDETYAQFYKMTIHQEEPVSADIQKIITLCSDYFHEVKLQQIKGSVFPELWSSGQIAESTAFCMIRFLSYFHLFLLHLHPLAELRNKLDIPVDHFPELIRAFTIEFIPSFVGHHNVIEKVGDAVLSLIIMSALVRQYPKKSNSDINFLYNITISNQLFNSIAEQFNFPQCIIGPIDEAKVPADCIEALAGHFFITGGYQTVSDFWHQAVFAIPDEFIQRNRLSESINAMRMDKMESHLLMESKTDKIPDFATDIVKGMRLFEGTFHQNSDFQQKCKMVGAVCLKAMFALHVFQTGRDIHDVEYNIKKHSLDAIAREINNPPGFPSSRLLKVTVGGIFLANGYDATLNLFAKRMVSHFNRRWGDTVGTSIENAYKRRHH